jgi:hypothetical protein
MPPLAGTRSSGYLVIGAEPGTVACVAEVDPTVLDQGIQSVHEQGDQDHEQRRASVKEVVVAVVERCAGQLARVGHHGREALWA